MNELKVILYKTKDVADLFNVDEMTVRRWVESGELPAVKIGSQWFFNEKDILKRLNTKREGGEQ